MALRRGPSDRELERYLNRGFTHRQIAEDWNRRVDEGKAGPDADHVKPKTVSAAISRAGLTRPRPRYDRAIPWRVRDEHSMDYRARMLRALERRMTNQAPVEDDEAGRLDRFLRRTEEINSVIAYMPDSEKGFHFVDRDTIPQEWIDPEIPIVIPTWSLSDRRIQEELLRRQDQYNEQATSASQRWRAVGNVSGDATG